jgi:hypothetical protein
MRRCEVNIESWVRDVAIRHQIGGSFQLTNPVESNERSGGWNRNQAFRTWKVRLLWRRIAKFVICYLIFVIRPERPRSAYPIHSRSSTFRISLASATACSTAGQYLSLKTTSYVIGSPNAVFFLQILSLHRCAAASNTRETSVDSPRMKDPLGS